MNTFKYRARSLDGHLVSGVIEAYDEFEAVDQIKLEHPIVEKIEPVKEANRVRIDLNEPMWVSDKVLSITASQFAIMLRAGLPMGKVVELIAGQTADKLMKRILTECSADVNAGYSLAQSLEKHGKKIPTAFIETVRAGEESGTLEVCFERLKVYYEKGGKVKQKVRGALTYPIIVILLMFVVVAIVMVVLVPTMLEVFTALGTELPLPTRMLIALSNFFTKGWPYLLAGITGIIIAVLLYGRTAKGGVNLGRLRLKLPVLGKIALMNAASQFANTMSVLLSAGLPAVRVLEIISRVVDSKALGDWLSRNVGRLESGEAMGQMLRYCRYLPPMLIEMVSIGESSGSLEDTMSTIGAFYDDEAEAASDRAIALLEPAITIVLGVMVGFIVIAIYLPMFSMETGVSSM